LSVLSFFDSAVNPVDFSSLSYFLNSLFLKNQSAKVEATINAINTPHIKKAIKVPIPKLVTFLFSATTSTNLTSSADILMSLSFLSTSLTFAN